MGDHIRIEAVEGTWVVRAGGAILGETDSALRLTEGDYDPVIYFPRADIAMAFLDASDKTTHCPHKGDARYFSIQTKSVLIPDAAWTYESPKDEMSAIAGHLAFHSSERITVEEI